jgi:hypothetical protein
MANNLLSLIGKDFRCLWSEKSNALMLLTLLCMSAAFAAFEGPSSILLTMMAISGFIQNLFMLDEKYRVDKFFASLPIRRRDIVLARYGAIIPPALLYFAIAYLANALIILFGKPGGRMIPLSYCALGFAVLATYTSLTMPFYFRSGISRAKAATMFLMFAPLMGAWVIFRLFRRGSILLIKSVSLFPLDIVYVLLAIGMAILICGASLFASMAWYSKRDL